MNVYIWTTELYKAYIGENPTWKPNEHTVAYRPLTATTKNTDQSWNNYTLAQTGGSFTTLWDVSCFYNGGGSSGYFNLTSWANIPSWNAARTISMWARPSGYHSSYSRPFLAYWRNSSAGQPVQIWTNTVGAYRAYVNGATLTANQTFTANTRSLITFVVGWGSIYLYVDWVQQATTAITLNTDAISSSYPLTLMRLNTSTSINYQVRWYLSEVIIEDKAWTATEIANYYNDNKAKYWL